MNLPDELVKVVQERLYTGLLPNGDINSTRGMAVAALEAALPLVGQRFLDDEISRDAARYFRAHFAETYNLSLEDVNDLHK